MEISALTRSVVRSNYAVISPDGFINSKVPGWSNCTVNVIINEAMGAKLCQTIITAGEHATLEGKTVEAQIFFYVIDGHLTATVSGDVHAMKKGSYVYIPINNQYNFTDIAPGTRLLTFHKTYEHLDETSLPNIIIGHEAEVPGPEYMNDPALTLQVLLPDNLSFDMAVNIFTYQSGGHLPMVETHIMEHGLLYLQGQGVYMLGQEWFPIKKGDSIWMGPYCQQWFTAMGKEPAVYIYYKNVNRFPTKI
jgi:(S)-ureidoglycine aminohydrolase